MLFAIALAGSLNRHGVAEPKLAKHYDRFGTAYSDKEEDEDQYDSSESYGPGWCHSC